MPRPAKVSVAILSWNGRHHLEQCLPAVADLRDPGCAVELLVFDNGSSDGTLDWLHRHHPKVRGLASATNLGFCAGCNRLAEAASGEAVVFLNNDTRPEPDWLAELVRALGEAPPEVAAVAGRIVDWQGERLDFGRGVMTFDGHAFQIDYRRPLPAARQPLEGEPLPFACGGNMIVRRASFLAAGGFDERYFAYLEDVDLGWRLWAGGERVIAAPAAVVRHRSGATSELLGLYRRGFLFERNAFRTVFRNLESGLWERLMPAVLWTLQARTQAMLLGNNPSAATLALDPYEGDERPPAPAPIAAAEGLVAGLARRLRDYGVVDTVRRAGRKLGRGLRTAPREAAVDAVPRLTDERTVAQFRVLSWLHRHLDELAAARQAVQARRRISDRELLARFPLYLVPTYPGDAELFAQAGFQALLPADLPLVHAELGEIMELG